MWATRRRLRSSTRPNLDAHETGRARSSSRYSRQGGSPVAGSGDDTEDTPPFYHPGPSTQTVDAPVRPENKTDQPRPDWGRLDASARHPQGSATSCPPPLSTGHHRRHLGSPRSAERHLYGCRDLGAHHDPFDLAYAAARTQRAPDHANQLYLLYEARFDGDIEQAKTAAREVSLVVKRARQALAQLAASAAARTTAALSPSTRPQGIASQGPRPGDAAFFKASVACMASTPRVEFSPALAITVVETDRPPHVREAGIVASARPSSGSGLDVHVFYALCRTDQSRLDPCPRQGPAGGPRRNPRPRLRVEPRRTS